jgi:putative heme-binding domain-containing protein
LEALHGVHDATAMDAAWPHLADPDPAIRYAARTAIEHQPLEQWQERALGEADPPAAVMALLALARAQREELSPRIIDRLNSLSLDGQPESLKLSALHVYDLCVAEPSKLPAAIVAGSARRLLQLVPAAQDRPTFTPVGMGGPLIRRLCPLLIRLDLPEGVPLALAELASAERQEDRMHYLFILRDARSGWTHERRVAYFTELAAAATVRGGQGMPGFLTSIRDDAMAALPSDEKAALGQLIDPPNEPIDDPLPVRPFVRQWRVDNMAELLALDHQRGDPEQGRQIYREAQCARCHRFHDQGQSFGPDLTSLAARFGRRDILESMLAPSLVVADSFRSMEVVTTDGRVLTGRVLETGDYRQSILRIATDPLRPWQTTEVNKDHVESYRESPVSPMPEGLLNTFSRDEIRDLLAYLETGVRAPVNSVSAPAP